MFENFFGSGDKKEDINTLPEYIGKDGEEYPSAEALEEANKRYLEQMNPVNKENINTLPEYIGKDGEKYPSAEALEEANKRYLEQMHSPSE